MGTTLTDTADLVRQAFDAPRLSIGALAERLDIPRGTLPAYITGKRLTPALIARRLAAVLRQHAEELATLAGTLEEVEVEGTTEANA